MTNISSIYESFSSLANGRNALWPGALSHQPLNFNLARKHVQTLLIEVAKVGVGIAGFIAVSYLMNQQASSLAAAGVCAVALGSSLLLASKVSTFFLDALKITTAIVVFQKGFLNLLAFPAFSSVIGPVKGLGACSVTNAVCRFVGGMFSFFLAFSLADSGSFSLSYSTDRAFQAPEHLIDRKIMAAINLIALISTRILGY